jgi:hypothetical protein
MPQATAIRHKRGGLYFEDFVVGELVEHRYTRTVTQMDNMLFSNMTLNPQPLHIDRHFCEQETEWGQPLMNSLFTLGLMIGMSVSDLTVGTTIANLGMTEATPCTRPPKSSRNGNPNRDPAPASSNSTTALTTRTTSWSPSAAARPSCACDPGDAFAAVRSRRQRS